MPISELADTDVDSCAKRLLGSVIERSIDGRTIKARVVETEAYDQHDPASHSFKRTARSEVMFGTAGRAYIYFIYGTYHCLNVVCGPDGFGSAILIRAAEPLNEFDFLKRMRGVEELKETLSGPGKLCQALRITDRLNDHDLSRSPLKLILNKPLLEGEIVSGPRIGIKKAVKLHRRFYIRNSTFVSRS